MIGEAGRYRGYDLPELERQYSPSSCIPDLNVYLRQYDELSAAARAGLTVHRGIEYGPKPQQQLDFFPATRPGAPLMVYVHGGYWQQLTKDDSSFPAAGLVPAGAAFAALGYGLAPRYPMEQIVEMVLDGLWWIASNLDKLPGRPSSVHLSGSSAGAHLVAMALLDGWLPDGRAAADVFASATLLSGIYDLEPLVPTYINDALGLDRPAATGLSPLRRLPVRLPTLIVARGHNETNEFARQHDEFVRAAAPRCAKLTTLVVRDRNHFDLPLDLGRPGSSLWQEVLPAMRPAVPVAAGSP